MKIEYFTTPTDINVSVISESGSKAIGKAILNQYYPDNIPVIIGSMSSNDSIWQDFVPKVESPQSAIVVVRDPVERFKLTLSRIRKTDSNSIDVLLADIENGGSSSNHNFIPATAYLVENTKLFKFPDHIAEIETELGLSNIPIVNNDSVDLTAEQLSRVEAIYAEDIALFQSITNPGVLTSAVLDEDYADPHIAKLETYKKLNLKIVKDARDKEYTSILTTSFGLQFKADLETIIDIKTIIDMLPDGGVYPNYKTANGTYHNITKEQFSLAITEGIQRKSFVFAKEYTLSQMIEAATTIEEVKAVVW